MSSQRHTPGTGREARFAGIPADPGEPAARREVPAAILDATRSAVLAVGVRRTTLTEVARRAGVSRMTVYRLVPDVETLVLDVLTREFAALIERAERGVSRRRTARARLVGVAVSVTRDLPDQPLFSRVLDVDPELLLPFLTDRIGSTQRLALGHLRRLVAEGHADGSIRKGTAAGQAMTVLMLVTPFVVSRRLAAEAGTDDLLRELATVLDHGLAP